jgi:hypothetical protein
MTAVFHIIGEPMILNFLISENHIKHGAKREYNSCPAALAIIDTLAVPCRVSVGLTDVYVYREGQGVLVAATPRPLLSFLDAFDGDREVKPGTYAIQLESLDEATY